MKGHLTKAAKNNEFMGSSTAVMAQIKDCVLTTVNLGDSGYLILRPAGEYAKDPTAL